MLRGGALAVVAACAAPAPARIANLGALGPARGEVALALVEPVGDGCALRRVDPVAHAAVELARLPGSCAGARVSWRRDLARAIAWFDPGTAGSELVVERAFEIEVGGHVARPFGGPARGDLVAEIGYGTDGAPLAFATHELPAAVGTRTTYLGHALDFTAGGDGIPAAALTYRRDAAGGWQLVDVTATSTGWDLGLDWRASPLATTLGPRSVELLEPHAALDAIGDPVARAALERGSPSVPDGDGWGELATPHGPVYVWQVVAEFAYTTGRIAWRDGAGAPQPLPALGLGATDGVAIRVHGRYLLVAIDRTGAHPRLYDLVAHRLVFASDTALATTFWQD